jgi:hypothetical protein
MAQKKACHWQKHSPSFARRSPMSGVNIIAILPVLAHFLSQPEDTILCRILMLQQKAFPEWFFSRLVLILISRAA